MTKQELIDWIDAHIEFYMWAESEYHCPAYCRGHVKAAQEIKDLAKELDVDWWEEQDKDDRAA